MKLPLNSRAAGVVLVVLLAYVGSSCELWRGYQKGQTEGREVYLRAHLLTIRDAIKRYTKEQGQPPQELDDLITARYLTYIPTDPMTHKTDWVIVQYECFSPPNCKTGIRDIHSASAAKSSKGNTYENW